MRLDNRQMAQLQQALLRSFNRDGLRMMVRLQLNEDLEAVAGDDDLATVVFDLIAWSERTNRVGDLVAGALAANPGSPELQQLAADYARWPASAPVLTPADGPQAPPLAPLPGAGQGGSTMLAVGLVVVALAALLFFLLRPMLQATPVGPAPVDPTLPAEQSPLATETATNTAVPAATIAPQATRSATPRPQAPRAPTLLIGRTWTKFDEQSRLFDIKSGASMSLEMRDLWSAPLGTPVDCASGMIAFSWQVRQPHPGGDELEIRHPIPRGGGRTEVLATGARGRANVGYCDTLQLHNLGLEDYRLEFRYASAIAN